MFHMVPGGTTMMSATPNHGPAASPQLQTAVERLNQLLERFLERMPVSSAGR